MKSPKSVWSEAHPDTGRYEISGETRGLLRTGLGGECPKRKAFIDACLRERGMEQFIEFPAGANRQGHECPVSRR